MHTTPDALRSELDLLNERCEALASGIRLRAWTDDEGGVTAPGVAAEERGLPEAA